MIIEFLGKFYDNHSLSIVNREIVLGLVEKDIKVKIIALDSYDPEYKLDKKIVKILKGLEKVELPEADIQVRHTYPPIWTWPTSENTKVVYIQPWEFPKAPFEWQYKFETFADALIVPSNYCNEVFAKGGMNPNELFTVPNGYNDDVYNEQEVDDSILKKLNIDKNKFNFIYVGNTQWRKGLDILLNTWGKCFSASDTARLIIKDNPKIYGKNNVVNEIVKLQYKTGCSGITYIEDDLSNEEMAALYKASKVVVHPYRAEGFGMHIQEAIACGCMPIVSSGGPTEDFVSDDGGIKIPVYNKPINIDDKSIFALKSGDAATLMGSHTFIKEPDPAGLEKALRFVYYSHDRSSMLEQYKNNKIKTWKQVADNYIDVFRDIAKRSPKRYR